MNSDQDKRRNDLEKILHDDQSNHIERRSATLELRVMNLEDKLIDLAQVVDNLSEAASPSAEFQRLQHELATQTQAAMKYRKEVKAIQSRCRALVEENNLMHLALRPFAALVTVIDECNHPDDSTCSHVLKASDIRNAARLLNL